MTRPRRHAATNQRYGARVLRSKSAGRCRCGPRMLGASPCEIGIKREDNIMKTKGSIFISCLAIGALIASPALGKPEKKSADGSTSKSKRMSPHTTQATPSYRDHQNRQNRISSRAANTRYYAAPRYTATRSYASRQYGGTGYYGATPYYGGKTYYGGTGYYYGGGSAYPYYSYYSGWPSNW